MLKYPTVDTIIDSQVDYINANYGKDALTNLGWGVSYNEETGEGWVSSKVYGHAIVDSFVNSQGHIIHKSTIRPL